MKTSTKKSKQTEDMAVKVKSSFSDSFYDALTKSSLISPTKKKTVSLSRPQITLKTKDQYKKQPQCRVCGIQFSTTKRQHHCRVCASSVCSDCAKSQVNKQKACDICIAKLSNPDDKKNKDRAIQILQTLLALLIGKKLKNSSQIRQLTKTKQLQTQKANKTNQKQLQQLKIHYQQQQDLLTAEFLKTQEENNKILNQINYFHHHLIEFNKLNSYQLP